MVERRGLPGTAFPQLRFSAEIAVGDVGFGPGDEIVLSPGPGEGNPPLIRVYSPEGKLLSDFAAPAVAGNFGAWVSTGCGTIWAFPGPAPRADQKIVQYDGTGNLLKELSFSDLPFFNGLRGTPLCARVTTPGGQVREEPHSLVLWGTDVAVNLRPFTSIRWKTEVSGPSRLWPPRSDFKPVGFDSPRLAPE